MDNRIYISYQRAKSLLRSDYHRCKRGFYVPRIIKGRWYRVGYVVPHGFYIEPDA